MTVHSAETTAHASVPSYALLIDGSTVEIRPADPLDAEAVREMHAAMSPDNLYLRFFSLSPGAADWEARRACREPGPDHAALLAWLGDRLVGVASYEIPETGCAAELAFAVPDDMHRRGIATLLLEHLVSLARLHGLTEFCATTLMDNAAMQRVFSDAGLPVRRRLADGAVELTFPLPAGDADQRLDSYLESVAGREGRADVVSLRHLLRPRSVAVIGAGRHARTVGRAILHNIVTGGFAGPVYAVNPQARCMEGLRCVASVDDLPAEVDLAIIAVPAADVPGVAAACGRRGVRALIVITSGLGAGGADLLAICRRHGMRLVGPDCLGVMAPDLGLNATFAASQAVPGVAGVVVQSGGVGITLLEHLSRLGIGVSSFASVGDKYDVSSNDLLTWWEQDETTRLAVLYVESFGSPRKFARTARRVGQRMPVLTVIGGRSGAGQSVAASRATAVATPMLTQEALFSHAGIIATRSLGELVDATALLACQPLPAGRRVAIVSNAGGAGALAADACGDNGLQVVKIGPATRRRLCGVLPAGAQVTGPVDTTLAVTADAFRACLEQVAADDGVDAIIAVTVPTAICDLRAAVTAAAVGKPMVVVLLGQAESVRLLRPAPASPDGAAASAADLAATAVEIERPPIAGIPAYAYPEGAARALGHAARYRAWRDRQRGCVPQFSGLRVAAARELVVGFLAAGRGGGWLSARRAAELMSCYEIPAAPIPDAGGTELMIRVLQDAVFGPLVVLAAGGAAADVLGDRAARLTPLTEADAGDLIEELRAAPLLPGDRGAMSGGAGAASAGALAAMLLRVSQLADDLPEVAELDLSPVVVTPDGAWVGAVRVRVSDAEYHDPFLRQLR